MPVEIEIRGGATQPPTEKRAMSLANPSPELLDALTLGNSSYAGRPVTETSALGHAAFVAAVKVIAESIASMSCILYERRSDDERGRATKHPLYKMLKLRPNEFQTAFEYWEFLVLCLLTHGNGISIIERSGRGTIANLIPVRPDQVQILRLPEQNFYTYRINTLRGFADYPASEIFHVRGMSRDGLWGMSPLTAARHALGASMAMEEFSSRFFGNGAQPSGVLQTDEVVGKETAERLKKQFETKYAGSSNAHRTLVLEEGLKYQPISANAKDSQLIEARKFQVQEIARIFRIPPHKLGDLERATFSNIESQELSFLTDTLQPWTKRFEQAISRDLLSPSEQDRFYAEFLFDIRQRVETQSRYESYAIALQNGFLSKNEVRRLENLDPIEDGDEYLTPLNLGVVGQASEVDQNRSQTLELLVRSLPEQARTPDPVPESRIVPKRSRMANERAKDFSAAATRLLSTEIPAVRRIVDTNPTKEGLRSALQDFYREHRREVEQVLAPIYREFASEIRDAAHSEVGKGKAPDLDEFVGKVISSATERWNSGSERQLNALIDESDDFGEAVRTRTDEWEQGRADKFAAEESVRVGGAVARATFAALGITKLIWRTVGETCPFCQSLNGKTVGIERTFLNEGDAIEAPGQDPLVVPHKILNPPIHRGCNCIIEHT